LLARPLDADRWRVPVDVAPLERDRLADPHARAEEDLSEGPVPVRRAVEVAQGVLAVEDEHRLRFDGELEWLIAIEVERGVGGDVAVADGTVEDLFERDQAVIDRLAAELRVVLLVEAGDVRLDALPGDLAEPQLAERRDEPEPEISLVVAIGRRLQPGALAFEPSRRDVLECVSADVSAFASDDRGEFGARTSSASPTLLPTARLIWVPSAARNFT
jgi:hypothetical protein